MAEIFTKMTFFPARNIFLEKNRPQDQFSKLKDFTLDHASNNLEGQPLNYLMHDPGLYGNGLRYLFSLKF